MTRTPKCYDTQNGRRWRIGYRDERGVERTRGGFLRRSHASAWYRQLEEARSQGRLKELLDEDAGMPAEHVESLHASWSTGSGSTRRSLRRQRRLPTCTSTTSTCAPWPATGRSSSS